MNQRSVWVTHVGVYWGEDVLSYRRIEPGSAFCWEGRALVEVGDDGGARLALWADFADTSELTECEGAEPLRLGDLRDDLGADFELTEGFSAELVLGAVCFTITHVAEPAQTCLPMPRSAVTGLLRPAKITSGVGVLVACAMGLSSWCGLPASVREEAREEERIELARQFLVRAAERAERKHEETWRELDDDTPDHEAGTGVRARGAEGSMGKPSRLNSRYGVAGPSRAYALRSAQEFGMVGTLRSGAGGPVAAFGNGGGAGTAAEANKAVRPGFEDHGVNPPTNPVDDPFSTFAIDVDTGSFAMVRRTLESGRKPDKAVVRPEEMLNYFNYGYPPVPPSAGHPFAATIDAAPSPYEPGHLLVRVAVQTKTPVREKRRPAHLVYLVDTSGSMAAHDKLSLVKRSLRMLTANLEPDDTVALCTYAGGVAEVLAPTSVGENAKILRAIDSLGAGGGTAMESGMQLAYELAERTLVAGHINRVIVLSDGDTNIGGGRSDILADIKRYRGKGITLSTVGFGTGNYRDGMMERLANVGDGNYSYVDDEDQARRVFVDGVDGLLDVVARDVKIQVAMDPRFVKTYRLLGYENRDVADDDFRKDTVDGGEIGAGHSVTAVYDVVLQPVRLASAKEPSWLKLHIRYKEPLNDETAEEVVFGLKRADIVSRFDDAPPSLRMASAVVGLAEILRESPYAKGWSIDRVLSVAESVPVGAQDRAELVDITRRTHELLGS